MAPGLVALEVIRQHEPGISGLGYTELVGDGLEKLVKFMGHPDGKIFRSWTYHGGTRSFANVLLRRVTQFLPKIHQGEGGRGY